MRIDIISAVPELMTSYIQGSILRIAQEKRLVEIHLHNLHDYALDRFRHIDDTPYGGGAGMIIKCQPIFDCIEKLQQERAYDEIIYVCADGYPLTQTVCNELSLKQNVIILAGHYKGIDQRVRDYLVTREISIGDYVLSGGELPALVLTDAIVRLIPGVIGNAESALEDSFQNGLLEPPQYTKPSEFRGMRVPEVLLSGNHERIRQWREQQALEKTRLRRPDLLGEG
ncbi:MAG TPA: tRNA (guanosine(37)-N1)-methyltransferase TrmD [Candidatus Kapabacteria bacterium]|nr:tRNA (guanosine(37)-N1)-methyltransferase TrmD [Candidatus Kapabacteria bacterium]HOM04543.1 tRNA (guanosine(37)-N1)-methyltransferase TrmD [Candidatus Kapabacteria bacterium]HOQ49340.1 tRNA (guanosine(37)-N1)-methyltransferase TrmD [Candidatus Kapabacteria bacterium]HPP39429.1 tRNA (guanosine(37)-N1)-methyltransferase TrmD [Candidatus Kapabacteria bacterium]HPU22633.1 tRNA (guanosine(37)-N1)-methyltransferase TrmD [Candidatus Kapabacteria bacterium]